MKNIWLVVCLAFSSSQIAVGQLVQRRPDFCGTPGALVPLPRNVSAISYPDKGYTDFFARDGAPPVRLDMDEVVDQVCQLFDRRVLVFGNSGASGTNIAIVDTEKASLVDTFLVYDPVLSPNKRWIVYRKFFPRQTDLPASDEYLLYDLSRSPAQNRPSEAFVLDRLDTDVGLPIYPVGWKNEPGDNIGAPDAYRHRHMSGFFWAPNSRAIVFIDILQQKNPEVVLITIGDDDAITASVYPYRPMECTGGRGNATAEEIEPAVQFGPQEGEEFAVSLKIRSAGCTSKALQLRRNSFRPAQREHVVTEKPTRRTTKGK